MANSFLRADLPPSAFGNSFSQPFPKALSPAGSPKSARTSAVSLRSAVSSFSAGNTKARRHPPKPSRGDRPPDPRHADRGYGRQQIGECRAGAQRNHGEHDAHRPVSLGRRHRCLHAGVLPAGARDRADPLPAALRKRQAEKMRAILPDRSGTASRRSGPPGRDAGAPG